MDIGEWTIVTTHGKHCAKLKPILIQVTNFHLVYLLSIRVVLNLLMLIFVFDILNECHCKRK